MRELLAFGRQRPYISGLGLVAVGTGALYVLPYLPPEEHALIYLVFVGIAAVSFGVRSAVVAAAASSIALSYILFFSPPGPPDFDRWRPLALLVSFVVVSALAVLQAATLRRREHESRESAARAHVLADLGAELSRVTFSESLTTRIMEAIAESSGATDVAVYRREGESLELRKSSTSNQQVLGPASRSVEETTSHWLAAGVVRDGKLLMGAECAHERWVVRPDGSAVVPMCSFDRLEGALFLSARADGRPFQSRDMELAIPVCGMLAMRFEGLRLQAEETRKVALKASEQLRTTLVAGVSHELKTPITVAKASIGGLLHEYGGSDDDSSRHALEDASRALDRLDGLVGGLLDIALIEADQWQAMMEAADIGDIIGSALSGLPAQQRDRVELDFPRPVPEVWCEPRQIIRVLRALLGNAFAYSTPGTPVTVEVRESGESVVIAVEDIGPGVQAAEKDAVFERLYRGSASEGLPGSGLGLAIAREIARLHGGEIVLAEGEQGARFELRLPVDGRNQNGGATQ